MKKIKDETMAWKVYARPLKTIFVAQLVIIPLFMLVGLFFLTVAKGEARIFMVIFVIIWEAACIAILVNAVKALKRMGNGMLEVAGLSGPAAAEETGFAAELRALEALRKEGLISDDEYQEKRVGIMEKKW